jgi:hypothetical protein
MKDQLERIEDAHNIEMQICPVCNCTDEQCGYCYGKPIYPMQAAMLKKMLQDEYDADNYEPDYDN